MIHPARRSGISVPLFSLRSSRSWGIGEIGDLPELASWLRAARHSVLQILPLNELAPGEASPYSALSAMAIDPQYISLWMLENPVSVEEQRADDFRILKGTPHIDYQKVRALKTRALRASFEKFVETEWRRGSAKAESFRLFALREAWWLDEYSLYRALRSESGERPWIEWPAAVRDRDASALELARQRLSLEVQYFKYVQWIADAQWRTVRRETEGIQILGDFPFMVTLDSADVWSRRHDFILDASVGTPPDAFSETGQEWGLPPYNWVAARHEGYQWLRLRARRSADLYDGFRIDHLVGFYRTYVRPLDGRTPYFLPEHEQEQRELGERVMQIMIDTGADVSVEDLGTVPDFVRASIARLGLPGYKVLRWEPGNPEVYPANSVAMTGTHDTEPLAVWWESLSPEARRRFGLDSQVFDADTRDAVLKMLYDSGSDLVLLPIQDVFGWRDRINQPATISDTNWTYVLPWPVDEMLVQPEARERAIRLAEWSVSSGRARF
jgi:4-alpha-glucanotransferase